MIFHKLYSHNIFLICIERYKEPIHIVWDGAEKTIGVENIIGKAEVTGKIAGNVAVVNSVGFELVQGKKKNVAPRDSQVQRGDRAAGEAHSSDVSKRISTTCK